MNDSEKASRLIYKIAHMDGRLTRKILSLDKRAKYYAEQGKILNYLWESTPQTTTDLSIASGLAKNTLTSMLNRLEQAELIYSYPHPKDKRKIYFDLTDKGKEQSLVGKEVNRQLSKIFYRDFTEEEARDFEEYLERVVENLKDGEENV